MQLLGDRFHCHYKIEVTTCKCLHAYPFSDNPSYFMKSSEEGITSIPMNEISTENNPNAITISMESTAGSNGIHFTSTINN